MRTSIIVSFFCFFLFTFSVQAQLENIIIEKYYISNDSDATDTTGSVLKTGSTTYRIYVDMKAGCKLTKLYGNASHELRFSSDSTFYNHTTEGQSYGRKFNIARYGESTTALDTWVTLGQVSLSKTLGKTYFGTRKNFDRNGSLVGGVNNDGGSALVVDGLLVNNDVLAGIPLTTNDGLDTMVGIPTTWLENGFEDTFGNDSTIFGSLKSGKSFASKNAFISNSGVMGVQRDSNQVLIAQLTTRGNISFALNLEIVDELGTVFQYVAKNGSDSTDVNVVQVPFLTYPIPCGCTDLNYLEYSASFGCSNLSACKTLVVIGCQDSKACNYDPNANLNVPSLCCYPGYCSNRDISLVCPHLTIEEIELASAFDLFPNPAQNNITVKTLAQGKDVLISIYDAFGKLIVENKLAAVQANDVQTIDISQLPQGMYFLQLMNDKSLSTKKFVKN